MRTASRQPRGRPPAPPLPGPARAGDENGARIGADAIEGDMTEGDVAGEAQMRFQEPASTIHMKTCWVARTP